MYCMLGVQMTLWNISKILMVWIDATNTELMGKDSQMLLISNNGIRRLS